MIKPPIFQYYNYCNYFAKITNNDQSFHKLQIDFSTIQNYEPPKIPDLTFKVPEFQKYLKPTYYLPKYSKSIPINAQ